MNDQSQEERTWTEEIQVTGHELVERVKTLIAEGNVRRLVIRRQDGRVLLEVPLTTGVAVGSVVTIFAPVLAALGALAALITELKIQVVRVDDAETGDDEDEEA